MRRLLLIFVAIVIVFAGAIVWRRAGEASSGARAALPAQAIPATIGTAERKDVPVSLTGLGTVQAFNTVTVKVRVDGELDKIDFTEGQDVKAGDVLAQIDPRPFRAALDLAKATKAKDQAQLENAKLDLNRYVTGGTLANTQQQIDTQGALVRQLEATVAADQANIDAAQVQLDYTTHQGTDIGPHRHPAARPGQHRSCHRRDRPRRDHAIAADLGGLHPAAGPVAEVIRQMRSSPEPLKVFAQTRDGQQHPEEGTLALVDNMIDQTTGSVRLKATFPNKDYMLWPGQYVSVRLLLKTLPQVVTVPSTAVQRGPDGMYVYVVKPDSTVAIEPVSVGQMSDGTSVIEKGLDAGTRIVTAGQSRLQPGSRIEQPATASAGGE